MRSARNTTDSGAPKQNIRALQQPARVRKANCEWIICLHAFTKATELHDQRSQCRASNENKCAYFEFQTSLVPIHLSVSTVNL
jgi:hypothetical protein